MSQILTSTTTAVVSNDAENNVVGERLLDAAEGCLEQFGPPKALMDEDTFVINPDSCTECVGFHDTQQCALVCPVECCLPDPDRVESEAMLFARAKTVDGIMPAAEELSAETSHFRAGEAAE